MQVVMSLFRHFVISLPLLSLFPVATSSAHVLLAAVIPISQKKR